MTSLHPGARSKRPSRARARLLTDRARGNAPKTPIPPGTPFPHRALKCPLPTALVAGSSPALCAFVVIGARPHNPSLTIPCGAPLPLVVGFLYLPASAPAGYAIGRIRSGVITSSPGRSLSPRAWAAVGPALRAGAWGASRPRAWTKTAINGRFCNTLFYEKYKLC